MGVETYAWATGTDIPSLLERIKLLKPTNRTPCPGTPRGGGTSGLACPALTLNDFLEKFGIPWNSRNSWNSGTDFSGIPNSVFHFLPEFQEFLTLSSIDILNPIL